MKHHLELHSIVSTRYFYNYIKKEVVNTFLLSYCNSKEFLNLFEDNLLTYKMIEDECNKSIFINPESPNDIVIYEEDIEKIIKVLYKELVEKILNKLVDDGILEMCWDSNKMEIIWRKKRGVHVSRRIKRYHRR